MELTIYNAHDTALVTLSSIFKGSKEVVKLMEDDYIELHFKLKDPISFPIGSYCTWDGKRYVVTEIQQPTCDSATGGYSYELKMEAYYMAWRNRIFKYVPAIGGNMEASFTLTQDLETHATALLRCINYLGFRYNGEPYQLSIANDDELKEVETVSYSSQNIIDALSTIAETWDTEWWVTDNVIHFGKCQDDTATPIDFVQGENVVSMESSKSQQDYATRVWAFGGTQNMPDNYYKADPVFTVKSLDGGKYFKATKGLYTSFFDKKYYVYGSDLSVDYVTIYITFQSGSLSGQNVSALIHVSSSSIEITGNVKIPNIGDTFIITNINKSVLPNSYFDTGTTDTFINAISENRLRLDSGYVDRKGDALADAEIVESVLVFEDIYPRVEAEISDVQTKTLYEKDEDGNDTTVPYTAYYIKTDAFTFDKDYQLANGENMQVKFTTGSLAGITFDVVFNPDINDSTEQMVADGQYFRIVRTEVTSGLHLPDETMHPEVGKKFILTGWDSTRLADLGLIAKAQAELLEETEKELKKMSVDPNTYECTLFSDYAYGLDSEGKQNPDYAKTFTLGRRVMLHNAAYFESGERESRIMGWERNMDVPYDSPVYTIGEKATYSKFGELQRQIDEVTITSQSASATKASSTTGGGTYLIKTDDATKPTDTNAYSALRTTKDFLHSREDDEAEGLISFNAGAVAAEGAVSTDEADYSQVAADGIVEWLYNPTE